MPLSGQTGAVLDELARVLRNNGTFCVLADGNPWQAADLTLPEGIVNMVHLQSDRWMSCAYGNLNPNDMIGRFRAIGG